MLYDHISTDNRNLLTMVDHFRKFGWVASIPNKKSQSVLDAIKLWFALHGKPNSFQSDNDTDFVNSTLKTNLEKEGVNHIRGSPYHPQSQGAVEALKKTILKFIYLVYDENNDKFELKRAITEYFCIIMKKFNYKVFTIWNNGENYKKNYWQSKRQHNKIHKESQNWKVLS